MTLKDFLEQRVYDAVDRGLIPDFILRFTARTLCRIRIRQISHHTLSSDLSSKLEFIASLRSLKTIALQTSRANEQHYEVSTKFILGCLGPRAKYSACLFQDGDGDGDGDGEGGIAEAEERTLEGYCVKGRMRDGLDVLDLGCGVFLQSFIKMILDVWLNGVLTVGAAVGWGSLTLYLAEKYPDSRIVGLSNSNTQREHILGVAKEKGFTNVEVITADVNIFDFTDGRTFDRIFSIGMFEHMKNYELLLRKVSTWLRPKIGSSTKQDESENTLKQEDSNVDEIEEDEALLFVHIFCHKTMPYNFKDDDSWMAKTFFSGGTMPSHDLLLYFQNDVTLLQTWFINGKHYSRTLEAWLRLQDKNAKEGLAELERDAKAKGMDPSEGRKAFYRFRLFYIACSEFFGLNGGEEWGVGHYLFKRKN